MQADILNAWNRSTPRQIEQIGWFLFCIRCGLGWVLGGLTDTISPLAVPDKTAKNTRKNVIFVYQNHKLSAWPLLYFLLMADIWNFWGTFLSPLTKNTFFVFQNTDSLLRYKGSKLPFFCKKNQKYQLIGLATYILSVYSRWLKFCDTFVRS